MIGSRSWSVVACLALGVLVRGEAQDDNRRWFETIVEAQGLHWPRLGNAEWVETRSIRANGQLFEQQLANWSVGFVGSTRAYSCRVESTQEGAGAKHTQLTISDEGRLKLMKKSGEPYGGTLDNGGLDSRIDVHGVVQKLNFGIDGRDLRSANREMGLVAVEREGGRVVAWYVLNREIAADLQSGTQLHGLFGWRVVCGEQFGYIVPQTIDRLVIIGRANAKPERAVPSIGLDQAAQMSEFRGYSLAVAERVQLSEWQRVGDLVLPTALSVIGNGYSWDSRAQDFRALNDDDMATFDLTVPVEFGQDGSIMDLRSGTELVGSARAEDAVVDFLVGEGRVGESKHRQKLPLRWVVGVFAFAIVGGLIALAARRRRA